MEEAEAGVCQNDPQLITGFNHNLVSGRTRRGSDELDATLRGGGRGERPRSSSLNQGVFGTAEHTGQSPDMWPPHQPHLASWGGGESVLEGQDWRPGGLSRPLLPALPTLLSVLRSKICPPPHSLLQEPKAREAPTWLRATNGRRCPSSPSPPLPVQ